MMTLTNRRAILDAICNQADHSYATAVRFQTVSGIVMRSNWWFIRDAVEHNPHHGFKLHTEDMFSWTLEELPEARGAMTGTLPDGTR